MKDKLIQLYEELHDLNMDKLETQQKLDKLHNKEIDLKKLIEMVMAEMVKNGEIG